MPISPEDILPNNNIPHNDNHFAEEILGSPTPASNRGLPSLIGGSGERAANFRGYTLEDLQSGIGQVPDSLNKLNGRGYGVEKQEVIEQGKRYNNYSPLINNEGIHADNQGTGARLINSGANLITKAVGFTIQNAGFILGAPGALIGQDITNMTDNFLVKAGDYINKEIADAMPIYHSDKYTQGNIWDKLATSSWWLDDGIDRLALTASMFVPGAAVERGIGLAGMVAKGLEAVATGAEDYSIIGKTFLPKLYKAATEGAVDLGAHPALRAYAQSLSRAELYSWNVIGQSALNAKETYDAILRSTNDKNKAAEGAKNAFWETVPITLAGSLVELPQMFSTARTAKSYLNKLFNPETGEALENAIKQPSWAKTLRTAALTGLEHGQNESLQVAISRYNEDRLAGKDTRGTVEGIFGDFLDNINDPNGQNNIALGTIQGILTTIGGKGYAKFSGKEKNETQQLQSILSTINQAKANRRLYNTDFIKRDENNKPVVVDGKIQYDQQKLADAGVSLAGLQESIIDRNEAISKGDHLTTAEIDHNNLANFAYNFFDDANGMEHLNSLLALEAQHAKKDANRVNDVDEHGNEITPDVQLQRNLNNVKQLKRVYDAIDQRHAGFMSLEYDKKNKEETQLAGKFIQSVKDAQYQEGTKQLFYSEQLAKNNTAINSLRLSEGIEIPEDNKTLIESPSNPMEERANDLIADNTHLENALGKSKETYKQLINKKELNKAFKQIINKDEEIKDRETPEEQKVPTKNETIKIKTKDGEEDVETNTPYYLGKVIEYSKDGKEIHRFPQITILKENEDGTIKIKASNGNIKDISKDELADYKLGRVEDVKNNPKASYLMEHINDKFQYNDNGNKLTGRLQYSPKKDTLKFVYKDENGKIQTKEVKNTDFQKQAGEADPKIKKIGSLTTAQTKATQQLIEEPSKQQKAVFDKLQKAQQQFSEQSNIPTEISEDEKGNLKELETTKNTSAAKPLGILFFSGTKPMTEAEYKPHHYREDKFASVVDSHPNRANFKALLVTKNTEEAHGLKGLIEKLGDFPDVIAYVFKDEKGFIDKEGNPVKDDDLDNLVFGVLPTSSTKWSNGEDRYSKGTKEEAEAEAKVWEERRKEILAADDKIVYEYPFNFSRGIKQESFTERDGKKIYDSNSVVGTLIEEKDLDRQGLVQIAINDVIQHNGESINFSNGTVVLENGSTLEFLNNRRFTKDESATLFKVIKEFAKEAQGWKTGDVAMTPKMKQIVSFLQGVMHWFPPKNNIVSRNQMWFNNGKLYFGKPTNSITLSEESIEANKEQLMGFLQEMFNGANYNKLKDNGEFTEIIDVNDDGSLKTITHKSYQHFLLSDKYILNEETSLNKAPAEHRKPPYSTSIRKVDPSINNGNDVNRKYRYPTLLGLYDRNSIKIEQKVEAKPESKEEVKTVEPPSDVEAKKSDIERRRKNELDYLEKQGYSEGANKPAREKINAKYDRELAELNKQQPKEEVNTQKEAEIQAAGKPSVSLTAIPEATLKGKDVELLAQVKGTNKKTKIAISAEKRHSDIMDNFKELLEIINCIG